MTVTELPVLDNGQGWLLFRIYHSLLVRIVQNEIPEIQMKLILTGQYLILHGGQVDKGASLWYQVAINLDWQHPYRVIQPL